MSTEFGIQRTIKRIAQLGDIVTSPDELARAVDTRSWKGVSFLDESKLRSPVHTPQAMFGYYGCYVMAFARDAGYSDREMRELACNGQKLCELIRLTSTEFWVRDPSLLTTYFGNACSLTRNVSDLREGAHCIVAGVTPKGSKHFVTARYTQGKMICLIDDYPVWEPGEVISNYTLRSVRYE